MAATVAIIGAGWYGCHLGVTLSNIGFDINVFEQADRPLDAASGNNQFRLHLGFHYPRHHETRIQSRDGFLRFTERYPTLTSPVASNVYAVPLWDSSMDFATYRLIMSATGLHFVERSPAEFNLRNIEGALSTDERVLHISRARGYFRHTLGRRLHLGARVTNIDERDDGIWVEGKKYDYLIDATWGRFLPLQHQVFFEPTLLLYYETTATFPALTFVDGALCSIYPTEDDSIYTLSSVSHTPLGRFADPRRAHDCLCRVDDALVQDRRTAMEAQIARYVPDFLGHFRFLGPQLAMKTKPTGRADDRSCSITRARRIFGVMSGKIDSIFFATERVLSGMEADVTGVDTYARSTLRDDVSSLSAGDRDRVEIPYR